MNSSYERPSWALDSADAAVRREQVQPEVSRRIPNLGCYYADRQIPLAETCGNFVIVHPERLFYAGPHGDPVVTALAASSLQIVLQLSIHDLALWYDPSAWPVWTRYLAETHAELVAHGLLERVRCLLVDEECSLGARGTRFDAIPGVRELKAADLPRLLDLVCLQQTRLIGAVRRQFPGVPIGTVEPHWTEDRTSRYYTPIPNIDVIGLDAYVVPPITRERFDRFVTPAYQHAATYGKPILMVGQSFADAEGLWAGPMPTVEQMRLYTDLAESLPQVVGLAWFLLEHPSAWQHGARSWGLTDYPDRLAAVQAYTTHGQISG